MQPLISGLRGVGVGSGPGFVLGFIFRSTCQTERCSPITVTFFPPFRGRLVSVALMNGKRYLSSSSSLLFSFPYFLPFLLSPYCFFFYNITFTFFSSHGMTFDFLFISLIPQSISKQ